MRFLIVTHVPHKRQGNEWKAYAPYVREMNLWFRHVSEVAVLAPLSAESPNPIDISYQHPRIDFVAVRALNFTKPLQAIYSFFSLPGIFFKVIREMRKADHIHLRCPGNMGLVGCFAQCFFPKKIKTAKYAGNWDAKCVQPLSFKLQRSLLRNTTVAKNMTTLVYGDWPNYTRNMKSFFTASYKEVDKKDVQPRDLTEKIRLIFVGTLVGGKRPALSAEICKGLKDAGVDVELHFYGEGPERKKLEAFVRENQMENEIFLHGNQTAQTIQKALQTAHFLVFMSTAFEGWPKAVAESMWWGCLPVTAPVSCVPYMLANGERGELVDSVARAYEVILFHLKHPDVYRQKCLSAMEWARKYTLELFESEIEKLLRHENIATD